MGVHILWLAVFKKLCFLIVVTHLFPSVFFCFLVNSAGINSSSDSSYFVHHQADKYLCGESANFFLSSFAG